MKNENKIPNERPEQANADADDSCISLFMTGSQPNMHFLLRVNSTDINHPVAFSITDDGILVRNVSVTLATGPGAHMDIPLSSFKPNHASALCPLSQVEGAVLYPDEDVLTVEFPGQVALTACQQFNGNRGKNIQYNKAICPKKLNRV